MDVDELLREILTGHEPTSEDLRAIVEQVASADFVSERSLAEHVAKRIADEQWHPGIGAEELLDDARRVARGARLLGVYLRRGGLIAAFIADRARSVPARHLGEDPEPEAVVLYSVDRGKVISVYQFWELTQLAIPEDALWFRLIH